MQAYSNYLKRAKASRLDISILVSKANGLCLRRLTNSQSLTKNLRT